MKTYHSRRRPARRRSRRDPPARWTTSSLLARWAKTGDRDTGLIASDALRASGYEMAADDLDWGIKELPLISPSGGWTYPSRWAPSMLKKRISHIKRIFSETNGGRVIERGLWPGSWVYIAIFEVPKEKVVIWNRYNKGDFEGLWDRYGEYKLEDYKNVREMFKDVQSDIRLGPGPSRGEHQPRLLCLSKKRFR